MKRALAAGMACLLVTAAGPAGAQANAPAPSASPESTAKKDEPRLNLRLDETSGPRPRIQFGPGAPAAGKGPNEPASTLPSLGDAPGGRSFDRPAGGGSGGGSGAGAGPYPKDTNPGL